MKKKKAIYNCQSSYYVNYRLMGMTFATNSTTLSLVSAYSKYLSWRKRQGCVQKGIQLGVAQFSFQKEKMNNLVYKAVLVKINVLFWSFLC